MNCCNRGGTLVIRKTIVLRKEKAWEMMLNIVQVFLGFKKNRSQLDITNGDNESMIEIV